MLNQTYVRDTTLHSPLASASILNPKNAKPKKTIFADLLLTSLVDAFSILVIYLLLYFGGTGEVLDIDEGTILPAAHKGAELVKNTVVKLKDGKYYVDNKEVASSDQLVERLVAIRQEMAKANQEANIEDAAITIQADKRVKYEALNQVVLASSHAGFSDIHFAVLQK